MLVFCGWAWPMVLEFDDVTTVGEAEIFDGYGGFDWENMNVLDAVNYEGNPSGFGNGLVSGDYVAYNYFSNPASVVVSSAGEFDFIGSYLTAAWRNGLNIDVEGYLDDGLVYSDTVVVDYDSAAWCEFNYAGIDELVFNSWGGTQAPGVSGSGAHFVMDDFTFVPEPGTVLLFGVGVLMLCRGRREWVL